jgi:hypothetical protein
MGRGRCARRSRTLLPCLLGVLVAVGSAPEARGDCSELGLPPLWVGDLDGDGRYTGGDIGLALESCAALGGCTLMLLAQTYDDVALFLHQPGDAWGCTPERTWCSTDAFPNGLVIRGQGSATVLRSPLWKAPYLPHPILEVRRRPEVRLQLRDLVLDGRKAEQTAPSPGTNDQVAWLHHGFQSWNQWSDHDKPSRNGCIRGVTARNLLSMGIALADASGWTIESSKVEDVGCQRGFTDCPALGLPDIAASPPGFQAAGYGIMVGWYVEDLLLQNNTVRRTTKYAIGLKHGQDGLETSIKRPTVVGNSIRDVGYLGLFLAGVENGRFLDNTIDSTRVHGEPDAWATSNNTFGVSCHGIVQNTTFSHNDVLNSAGIGINYQCSGEGNRIAHTRIVGSCREKNPRHCVQDGACYEQPDLRVANAQGSLTLEDVEIHDTRCAAPFASQADSALNLTLYDVTAERNACDDADLDGDGLIGPADWSAFWSGMRQCWGRQVATPDCDRVDVNGDGAIGLPDWGELQTLFGRCSEG